MRYTATGPKPDSDRSAPPQRHENDTKTMYIAISGNIGSGKTSLTEMLTDRLGGTAKTVCHVISKIVVIVFSAVCFYFSFSIIQTQIMSGQVSSGLRVPMWIPYSALPLSFGIITIVQTVTLVLSFFTGKGDDIPEKKEAAE